MTADTTARTVLAESARDREPVRYGATEQALTYQAWQIAASVAVTPGDKPSFKSIKPKHPFDLDNGTWGAVELAARYTELRIDEDTCARGRSATTTFKGGAMDGNRATEHLISTRLAASI